MDSSLKKCFSHALNLLTKRDFCTYELIKKFKLKDFSDEVIELTLEKLRGYNYLDDDRYLEGRIRHYLSAKKGPRYIIQKCEALRLYPTESQIEEIAHELEIDFKEHILYHVQKKLNSLKITKENFDPKEKYKVSSKIVLYLQSKGHNAYDVTSYLRELNYEI